MAQIQGLSCAAAITGTTKNALINTYGAQVRSAELSVIKVKAATVITSTKRASQENRSARTPPALVKTPTARVHTR